MFITSLQLSPTGKHKECERGEPSRAVALQCVQQCNHVFEIHVFCLTRL